MSAENTTHTAHSPIEIIDLSTDSEADEEVVIEDSPPSNLPAIPQNEPEDPRLSYMKCVICLDSPTNLTVTPCGHLFCHECLSSALTVTNAAWGNCPVCRRKVTLKSLVPLSILKGPAQGTEEVATGGTNKSAAIAAEQVGATAQIAPNTRPNRRKRPAPG